MGLEMKLFYQDNEPKSVDLNMRLNLAYKKHASENDAVLVRTYKHHEGVILGYSQSLDDVWLDTARANGISVSRRNTGGAAIYATPQGILCYSVFAPVSLLSAKADKTEVYEKFTFELARQLGSPVMVGGTYYLQTNHNGDRKTFAGHSLSVYGKKSAEKQSGFVQIDGIVHVTRPDADKIKSLIKLRDLYEFEGKRYVIVGNKSYVIDNKVVREAQMPTGAIKIRSEHEELRALPSLKDIGFTEEYFVNALKRTANTLFGKLDEKTLQIEPAPEIDIEPRPFKSSIGHCFVYMGETEDYGVLFEVKK